MVAMNRRDALQRVSLAGLASLAVGGLQGCATVQHEPVAARACRPWQPDAAFLADLPRLMRTCQVPGLATVTLHEGRIRWQHHTGLARADGSAPITPDTVFEAASLSKPVFAWLVLRLADLRLIDLDEPLTARLRPAWLAQKDPRLDRITARDVLRHTSGLPNWRRQPLTEPLQPDSEPGERIRYSGEAFFWLQLVVEQVTNTSLETLARHYLFQPAGMQHSSFAWDDVMAQTSADGHAAPNAGPLTPLPPQGFRRRWEQAMPWAWTWQKPVAQWRWADAERAFQALGPAVPTDVVAWPGDLMANSAASLRCTAADYARFLSRVLAPDNQPPHLSPARHALHTEPQFQVRAEWSAKTLGWNHERTRHGPVLYHGGNNANQFRTFALAEPATGRGLVVMTNGGGGATVYQQLIRAATGLDLLAFEA